MFFMIEWNASLLDDFENAIKEFNLFDQSIIQIINDRKKENNENSILKPEVFSTNSIKVLSVKEGGNSVKEFIDEFLNLSSNNSSQTHLGVNSNQTHIGLKSPNLVTEFFKNSDCKYQNYLNNNIWYTKKNSFISFYPEKVSRNIYGIAKYQDYTACEKLPYAYKTTSSNRFLLEMLLFAQCFRTWYSSVGENKKDNEPISYHLYKINKVLYSVELTCTLI